MAIEYYVNETTDIAVLDTEMGSTEGTTPTQTVQPNMTLLHIELVLSGIIVVSALFGNLLVVNTLWRKRKNLTRMHFFIYHLCIADILSAVLSQFPLFVWNITVFFYGPDILCRLVKFFQVFPIYLSSYILILTALDRYLAICHPLLGLRGNQKLRMRTMVTVVWVVSAIFASPQLFLFRLTYVPVYGAHTCWTSVSMTGARIYVTLFTLAVFAIPSALLAVIYGLICSTVWRNMAKATGHKPANKSVTGGSEGNGSQALKMQQNGTDCKQDNRPDQLYRSHTTEARVSRAKIKTVKMTLTIVTVYIISWSPFFFALLWSVWVPRPFHEWIQTLFEILANINACTNPWIYLIFSGNVVGALRDLAKLCYPFHPPKEHLPVPTTGTQGDEHSGGRFANSPDGPRTTMTSGQDQELENNNANAAV